MRNEQMKIANDVEDVIHLISRQVAPHRRLHVAKAVGELGPVLWGAPERATGEGACFYWIPRRQDERSEAFDRDFRGEGQC